MQRQAPWLFALLLLNLPIMAVALLKGRRPAGLRRVETVIALATGALMLWSIVDGPLLRSPAGDAAAKFAMLAIVLMMLVDHGLRLSRRVRPTPGVAPAPSCS